MHGHSKPTSTECDAANAKRFNGDE
jgi:hypothetical protein